jgi:YkoY family integral membrane protein
MRRPQNEPNPGCPGSMLADLSFYGQVFSWHDLAIVGLLIVLEGVLSIDNALVLGLLAKRLPKSQQPRALTYGLVGAFAFRLLAIGTAGLLLKWRVVKLIGGGYLVYIAVKHLFFSSKEEDHEKLVVSPEGEPQLVDERTGQPLSPKEEELEIAERVPVDAPEIHREPGKARFWPTVLVIELTDIAFAVDSILAAIALVGAPPRNHPAGALHPKLWVVLVGGFLGVVLMRFAAVIFIKLLERFPRFEEAAYLLVIVIGGKLLADYFFNNPPTPVPENWHAPLDFHSPSNPAFWVFWILMVISFCVGFLPKRRKPASGTAG